jgi:hypothetical protein
MMVMYVYLVISQIIGIKLQELVQVVKMEKFITLSLIIVNHALQTHLYKSMVLVFPAQLKAIGIHKIMFALNVLLVQFMIKNQEIV